jgi:ribosomal protein S12 methylthiotransferase accessory factor
MYRSLANDHRLGNCPAQQRQGSAAETMLKCLFNATADRFSLISFGEPGCPVYCLAALPRQGTVRGAGWLPPAARPESRRAALGKGRSAEAAAFSCLGEAVELISACRWGDEPIVRASAADLQGRSVALCELLLISDRQYAERQSRNRRHGGVAMIPDPVAADCPQDWLEVRGAADGAVRLIPARFGLIGYDESDTGLRAYAGNSNGCAAGATADDALVAGFLELVERDATAIWWYGQHQRPAVALADLRWAGEMARWLHEAGRTCQVIDISTDLGIAATVAISATVGGTDVALGFAAHFDAERAIEAALAELCQQLLARALQVQSPGGNSPGDVWWDSSVTIAALPHLQGHGTVAVSDLPAMASSASPLSRCIETCARNGLELLALDLTRPSLGVPVVRAVVPGLRDTLPNFAPGRLYDVPARLGWERRPQESELCPLPLID